MRWPTASRRHPDTGSRSTRAARGAGSSAPARWRPEPTKRGAYDAVQRRRLAQGRSRCRSANASRPLRRPPAMQIRANGIRLEVEEHGPRGGEPLLLIMGLGMQLLGWHEDFVQRLVEGGFRVIRFDNRDIGLSQDFDHLGVPNLAVAAVKHAVGLRVDAPYTLADMADD